MTHFIARLQMKQYCFLCMGEVDLQSPILLLVLKPELVYDIARKNEEPQRDKKMKWASLTSFLLARSFPKNKLALFE